MADYDDDDREREDDREYEYERAKFPVSIIIASIIWILIGCMCMLGVLIQVAQMGMGMNANPGGGGGPQAAGFAAGIGCSFLIGILLLVGGIQSISGKASDVLLGTIVSLLYGLLNLACGAMFAFGGAALGPALQGANKNAGQPGQGVNGGQLPLDFIILVAVLLLAVGAASVFSGILGLAGRPGYFAWREAQSGTRRRVRRSDEFDQDYEENEGEGDEDRRPR